jgi:hypothetical protein
VGLARDPRQGSRHLRLIPAEEFRVELREAEVLDQFLIDGAADSQG